VKERQRIGLWCPDCKDTWANSQKDPPCEQCFPGLEAGNFEVWFLVQTFANVILDSTVEDKFRLADLVNVEIDPLELILKINEIKVVLEEDAKKT